MKANGERERAHDKSKSKPYKAEWAVQCTGRIGREPAGPAEKEEKFVKAMEASSASNKKPSQTKPRRWPNGQRDPCRFHELNSRDIFCAKDVYAL